MINTLHSSPNGDDTHVQNKTNTNRTIHGEAAATDKILLFWRDIPVKEQRKYQRFTIDLQGTYLLESSKRKRKCKIREISREGSKICLHTRDKITVGTRLKVAIEPPGGGRPVKCILSVLWLSSLSPSGRYRYACGGTFDVICNEDRWRLLDAAFEKWKQRTSFQNVAQRT